jgi:putative ABC transport system substrate-binding protein
MKKVFAMILAAVMLMSMTACAGQEDGKYVIGICQLMEHPALSAATQGFKDAVIAELGEENVTFDVQIAAGEASTCTNIVLDFVSSEVDLILANATPALQAAFAATEDIPILGTSITEYSVAMGLKDYNGVVGGNVSGTSDLAPLDQQAAMIKEWFPDAKTVGLLYCAAEPNSKYQVDTVQAELEKLGLTCKQHSFSSTADMDMVTRNAAAESDVIYVPTDNVIAEATGIIKGICVPAGVPVIAGEQGVCSGCGVATLSIDYYDLGVATGKMAVKILTGQADISTMPVEYAPEFKKLYNPEICSEMKINIPEGYSPIE